MSNNIPPNNRMNVESGAASHSVWSNDKGQDQANNKRVDRSRETQNDNLFMKHINEQKQNVLNFAKQNQANNNNNNQPALEQRGTCKKCNQMGHLTFQCKNFLKLKNPINQIPEKSDTEEILDLHERIKFLKKQSKKLKKEAKKDLKKQKKNEQKKQKKSKKKEASSASDSASDHHQDDDYQSSLGSLDDLDKVKITNTTKNIKK